MTLRYNDQLFRVPDKDLKVLQGLIGDRQPYPFFRDTGMLSMFAEEKPRGSGVLVRHTGTQGIARLKLDWDETVEAVEAFEGPVCFAMQDYDNPVPSKWQQEKFEKLLKPGTPRTDALSPLTAASWWASDDETDKHYYILSLPPCLLIVQCDADDRIQSYETMDHEHGGELIDSLLQSHLDAGTARAD